MSSKYTVLRQSKCSRASAVKRVEVLERNSTNIQGQESQKMILVSILISEAYS